MRRILCFGDSNTYGYDAATGGRFDESTRWPRRMATILGADYSVIEEGFGGRTCVMDDPTEGGFKSGASYLPPCLMSHNPLDMVVVMLGTNDTKRRFGLTPMTIAEGLQQLVRLIKLYAVNEKGEAPAILIVTPAPIGESLHRSFLLECFGEQSIEVSRGLSKEYARIARLQRCDHFYAEHAEVSKLDAIHLTADGHKWLASSLAEKIKAKYE